MEDEGCKVNNLSSMLPWSMKVATPLHRVGGFNVLITMVLYLVITI
jgi:hypothetical protein